MKWVLLATLAMPSKAMAARSIMEGIRSSQGLVFVDTVNNHVDLSTNSYNGKVSNVSLYVASNVVVSNTNADKCVIYSTGSISCSGSISGSGAAAPWTKSGTNVSLTVSGDNTDVSGNMTIVGTSTLRGNALSVNGTDLTVKSNNTGLGIAQGQSKLHVFDGNVQFTSATASRGIIFQDGTTQTTAGAGIVKSSFTTALTGTLTLETSISGAASCVSGSTITFTNNQTKVRISWDITGLINSATVGAEINFLVDGAFVAPYSKTRAADFPPCNTNFSRCGAEGSAIISGLTAASHTFCLSALGVHTSGGSFDLTPANSSAISMFGVEDLVP